MMNTDENLQMLEMMRRGLAASNEMTAGTIGAMLNFQVLECDVERGEYLLQCSTADWMRNIMGILHGGISATIMDHAMGVVANSVRVGKSRGPTVQLQLSYHRPLPVGENVTVRVQVLSTTRTMTHMTAQAFSAADPDKLCVSGTGIYYFKGEA